MVDHTTRRYTFQDFTSFLLIPYRCPQRHIHEEMKDLLLSAILILPVTLAPPTGFHASKKRDRPGRHKKIEFSCLLAGDFNHPMNYCFQILESISLVICFLSCFSVNACRSNSARVSASSSLLLAWAWDTSVTCSKHSPGGHVYCELTTEKFLYQSFRQ